MKVFKFGGASIKDVAAIRNMASIMQNHGDIPLVVVVSAMGKTTRHLEGYYNALTTGKSIKESLQSIKSYHLSILEELFGLDDPVLNKVEVHFNNLERVALNTDEPFLTYDQIVSHGELISSQIVSAFLNNQGISTTLSYAPDFIQTSRQFGGGVVDWELTNKRVNEILVPKLGKQIVVTQGYIGGTELGEVVTLGKEGSDYTAAIIGSCLDAESVTIWKDVPGVLNGDPKLVKNTRQVMKLPYREASEMTYYGASVIHPKTIKPLALKGIPLVVRSFDNPELTPTVIGDYHDLEILPNVIFKKNQCLFSFRVKDYTFVDQFHLAIIFGKLSELNISINLMQNSAISVSVCFDYEINKVEALLSALAEEFAMHYNSGLELITIKNFDQEAIDAYRPHHREILLEQKTRDNYRFLVNTYSEE